MTGIDMDVMITIFQISVLLRRVYVMPSANIGGNTKYLMRIENECSTAEI